MRMQTMSYYNGSDEKTLLVISENANENVDVIATGDWARAIGFSGCFSTDQKVEIGEVENVAEVEQLKAGLAAHRAAYDDLNEKLVAAREEISRLQLHETDAKLRRRAKYGDL